MARQNCGDKSKSPCSHFSFTVPAPAHPPTLAATSGSPVAVGHLRRPVPPLRPASLSPSKPALPHAASRTKTGAPPLEGCRLDDRAAASKDRHPAPPPPSNRRPCCSKDPLGETGEGIGAALDFSGCCFFGEGRGDFSLVLSFSTNSRTLPEQVHHQQD